MGVSPIDLQKALSGIDYPASREELVRCAKSNNASQDVLDVLDELPDSEYDGPSAVNQAASREK
jgi:hypothetical protein